MADPFDPYRTWLGIPPEDQPPNHYRLLAIPLFEDQPEAIEYAADQRMMLLRTLQTGEHAKLSQQLLNEVAAARICLLNAEKKAAYDEQLRRKGVGSLSPPPSVARGEDVGRKKTPDPLAPRVPPPPAPPRRPPVVAPGKGVGSLFPPPSIARGEDVSRKKTPDPLAPCHAAGPAGSGSSGQKTVEWTGLGQLGEYKLLEKLGAGGMGEVYKAVHTEMDRVVALKVLPPGHLQDERAVARFKREIKAVASLSHPNIVQAFDAREIEGTRFLVMEYVEGLDLRDVAKRLGPLPIPEACEIVRQAALGLQCAHEHGLVHRDIKPGNLMLAVRSDRIHAVGTRPGPDESGHYEPSVKLLDLGLARPQAEAGDDEVTGTGEAMGTADFMAPEQAQDSRLVDIRADLYSLGCTLYRLIAGRPPFGGPKYNTPVKKLLGHIQDPVPPITQFRPDVPKRLEIILGRLLAKDPAKRLHTPAEVAEALVPLAVGSDLAALYGRAASKIAPPPAPPRQAEVATFSRPSSRLTRFLQRFGGAAAKPHVATSVAGRAPRAKLPAWTGYAAVAAVVLLIVLAWGVWSASRPSPVGQAASLPKTQHKHPVAAHPKTQHLLLRWPAAERADASLEIDRWPRKIADLADPKDPDLLKIELNAGPHKVWIERRGFEPFEQTVKVEPGKDLSIRAEWVKPPEVAVTPPRKPEPEKPKPQQRPPEEPKPKNVAEKPAKPEQKPKPPQIDPAERERREREARYADALAPAQALIAKWDFAGAAAALEKLSFAEPALAARLGRRREEVRRMAALKARIVAKINAARPPLKKSALMIKGINGDVVKADGAGISTKLSSGKAESFAWDEIGTKAPKRLVGLVIDRQDADDWLAAGLLSLASGDTDSAEGSFAKARELGTDIGPYLAPLAAAVFAKAEALLDKKDFIKAEAALSGLEARYGNTPWFAANRASFGAARAEAEAEKLYAEAAALFNKEELFDVRPLVEKLRADYANTATVTDTARKPTFAELEKAVSDLGNVFTVRQDGKGDFKSIQAAIDAAAPNSLIEIHDNGSYEESLVIADQKRGTTLRGGKGFMPTVISMGKRRGHPAISGGPGPVLAVAVPNVTVERLVLINPGSQWVGCLRVEAGSFRLGSAILYNPGGHQAATLRTVPGTTSDFDGCVIVGPGAVQGSLSVSNTVWVNGSVSVAGGAKFNNVVLPDLAAVARSELRYCTMAGTLALKSSGNILIDSIVEQVDAQLPQTGITFCNIFGSNPFAHRPGPGKGCFGAPPQFVDVKNLDYRLLHTSPCRGKASDGGDIGCRYTPEMIEMCKKALELRAKGIIKF